MIDLMTILAAEFRKVLAESYHEKNTKTTVVYPYLTFDIDGEQIERNVDGFYVDVDIFDAHSSYSNVFTVEGQLRDHFKDNKQMTDELYIRFNFLRSTKITTGDDLIKRRNLQFYCKVDWRNK